MNARGYLLATLSACTLALSSATLAQPQGRLQRLGFLAMGVAGSSPTVEQFRAALRNLGWIEGQNIAIEFRWADGRFERLPELAGELVRWGPDVLVTVAPQGYHAVRSVTKTAQVVIISCDPVDAIVKHIARPSGHVTGVTCMSSDITPKRLQLLKETAPRIRRVAVLYNPFDPNKAEEVRLMNEPAHSLGLALHPIEARDASAVEAAVAVAVREGADALIVLNDPLMFQVRKLIAELAGKHKLPAMYPFKEYAEAGGLISYGTMQGDLFKRAAAHADKVLRGARSSDVPVEQATQFEFVVNLQTAKSLGLVIPASIMLRADQVIE